MKIELEEPFKSKWKHGYLQAHGGSRRYLCLYNTDTDRTITAYARYIYAVYLGYDIPPGYEVDHIDDDKTNDCLWNLQLLTEQQNKEKEEACKAEEQTFYGYRCAVCDEPFVLTMQIRNMRLKQSTTGLAYCSDKCSRINTPPPNGTLTEEEKLEIKNLRLQGLSSYKISKITGKARNTVVKYWK